MEDFSGKRVLIIGAGLSGAALARLLLALGAKVTLADQKTEGELPDALAALGGLKVATLLGKGFPKSPEGFDLVAISPGVPIDHPLLLEARRMGIPVAGELGIAASRLSLPLCAVTGSNGKTSVAQLSAHILGKLGYRPFLGGNIGNPLAALAERVALGEAPDFGCLVLEVSSFQLETMEDFRPNGAALLNLSPDHLDRHRTMGAYLAAKARIFQNQGPSDVAVLNLDDPGLSGLSPKARLFGFSRVKDPGPFGARVIGRGPNDWVQAFERGGLVAEAPLSDFELPGPHNQENLMAALGLARSLGAGLKEALGAAKGFRIAGHRMERVGTFQGVSYYDDSKGTNTGAVMAALSGLPDGKVILIMGGRDKDMDFAPLQGPVRAKVKHLILIGEAADKLESVLGGAAPLSRASSMGDAVGISRAKAEDGDAVVLSPGCASFDMFKDYKDRGDTFKREVLSQNGIDSQGGATGR
ncbi:MAG: UDP-N-acetylmuramoyl-L-alanine--D-glutamate ligase [Deltaproteobacteria bacterium]|jgi:UDP-N-acetylmuramoylalanine--D-glutamate ligase|nr:UDP-N-acetylmuramoyl-L-alanine--D-glutamate ligase [Deltaproteobacteria bacterium]